jgi:peptidoglycan/xylan/chitin deacetylase (PgdA/CDA1 family)
MSQPHKSKQVFLASTAVILLLAGWLAYLRKVEGGLSNVFSLEYWQNHWSGLELYRPSVKYFTRGNNEHRDVCLTFDDGPHVKGAPLILDVLKKEGIHGTFFVVGIRVKEHPELVKRMIDEGNEVGNHTQDHIRLDTLPLKNVRAEVRNCEINVERASGRRTALFRPPGMRVTHDIMLLVKSMGYTTVGWNVGAHDFIPATTVHMTQEMIDDMNTTPNDVAERVISNTKPGVIILLHDNPVTAAALPTIIKKLRADGYSFKTVTEMLASLPKPVQVVANPIATDKFANQKMPPLVPLAPKSIAVVKPAPVPSPQVKTPPASAK